MNMDLYWQLGDLWTKRERTAAWKLTYHERRCTPRSIRFLPPNKHDRLAAILSNTHLALVKVWAAYHFSSWPPETVRRLEEELADFKTHCATYPAWPQGEQMVTKILEAALAEFKKVLENHQS
jgi:hypothetical protein